LKSGAESLPQGGEKKGGDWGKCWRCARKKKNICEAKSTWDGIYVRLQKSGVYCLLYPEESSWTGGREEGSLLT